METGGLMETTTVPEELVEKFLAVVPFPAVFKARCLGKSWLARLSFTSQRAEPEKSFAAYFQKLVQESSHNWETFCPFVIVEGHSFAYHRAIRSWKSMPSFSFLPTYVWYRQNLQLEGALLLVSNFSGYTNISYSDLYVANVFTKRWKRLPVCQLDTHSNGSASRASHTGYTYCTRLVISASSETYQVIRLFHPQVLYEDPDCHSAFERSRVCLAQLYDSKSDAWTTKKVSLSREFSLSMNSIARSVYLDGMVYMVPDNNPEKILAYSLAEGIFKDMPLLYQNRTNRFPPSVHLVVCAESLLLIVVYWRVVDLLPTSVELFKIDLKSQEMLDVAQGPPAALNFGNTGNCSMRPVAEGNCIFFMTETSSNDGIVLMYDLVLAAWSLIPMPAIEGTPGTRYRGFDMIRSFLSFQPGLVPFIEV